MTGMKVDEAKPVAIVFPTERIQMNQKNLRLFKLHWKLNLFLSNLLLQMLFHLKLTMSLYQYNQHIKETVMQTHCLLGTKPQGKPVERLHTACVQQALLSDINGLTKSEKV